MFIKMLIFSQVSVSISLFSAFRSATNFTDPDSFHPERWLSGSEAEPFARDKKEALQPFSSGPRSCLGQQ